MKALRAAECQPEKLRNFSADFKASAVIYTKGMLEQYNAQITEAAHGNLAGRGMYFSLSVPHSSSQTAPLEPTSPATPRITQKSSNDEAAREFNRRFEQANLSLSGLLRPDTFHAVESLMSAPNVTPFFGTMMGSAVASVIGALFVGLIEDSVAEQVVKSYLEQAHNINDAMAGIDDEQVVRDATAACTGYISNPSISPRFSTR